MTAHCSFRTFTKPQVEVVHIVISLLHNINNDELQSTLRFTFLTSLDATTIPSDQVLPSILQFIII